MRGGAATRSRPVSGEQVRKTRQARFQVALKKSYFALARTHYMYMYMIVQSTFGCRGEVTPQQVVANSVEASHTLLALSIPNETSEDVESLELNRELNHE